MRLSAMLLLLLMAVSFCAVAQQPPAPPQVPAPPQAPPPPPPPPPAQGKWWKNSETVRALSLSDAQVAQLEGIFLQHQPRLSELRTALLREEQKLRNLLETDRLDEGAVSTQMNAVGGARTMLGAENSEMTLAMRRVLTGEQWRMLEKVRQAVPPVPSPPPPPPTGISGKVYDTSAPGLQMPEPVVKPIPPYPPEAKAAKIQGLVLLQVIVLKDGTVGYVNIVRDPGYGLGEAAAKWVKSQWRFRPGMMDGKPVDVRANVEISFRLS